MLLPRKFIHIPLCAAMILTLPACGFKPLYGTQNQKDTATIQSDFQNIAIDLIPNREGQILRNLLIDAMHNHGTPYNPDYRLSISEISETTKNLDITKTADTTRAQLKLGVTMRLYDTRATIQENADNTKPQPALLTRELRSITSYNVLSSEFATQVAEKAARENALNDLSNQIQLQLGLYFRN